MLRLPVPELSLRSVYELTPELAKRLGLRLLLLDLDNTLSPYGRSEIDERLPVWLDSLKRAGIETHIFSNSRGNRPEYFSKMLGVEYTRRAKKPNPRTLLELLRKKGVGVRQAALVGDQIYTDVFCARRAGVLAVAVRPISLKMPHRALRYAAEAPFRLAGGRKRNDG